MKGALVFIAVFLVLLLATLLYAGVPPGRQIYDAVGLPTTGYLAAGVAATTLIISIFNGVVYGIIAWLIYTLAVRATKPNSPAQQQAQ